MPSACQGPPTLVRRLVRKSRTTTTAIIDSPSRHSPGRRSRFSDRVDEVAELVGRCGRRCKQPFRAPAVSDRAGGKRNHRLGTAVLDLVARADCDGRRAPESHGTLTPQRRADPAPPQDRVDLVDIEVMPSNDFARVMSTQFFEQRIFWIGSADASWVRPVIENQQSRSCFRCQIRQLTR